VADSTLLGLLRRWGGRLEYCCARQERRDRVVGLPLVVVGSGSRVTCAGPARWAQLRRCLRQLSLRDTPPL